MKKMLKRILVLVLAATIFIMPASTVMAASNPVVYYKSDVCVGIEFKPEPLYLSPGYAFEAANYADSTRDWYVPAGKNLSLAIFTQELNTTARVQIYKNGILIRDQATNSTIGGYQFNFTPESTDNRYRFVIMAATDMHVFQYVYLIY